MPAENDSRQLLETPIFDVSPSFVTRLFRVVVVLELQKNHFNRNTSLKGFAGVPCR